MDFKVNSWSWVGDIYHKLESMIQEVDDIMKEQADPVGQNAQDSSENKKIFPSVEAQAALQQAKEIHSPLTDGKKLDSCFRETNDTETAPYKLLHLHDVDDGRGLPNAVEQSREAHSSVTYFSQDPCDESEEGHTEATRNCKSTLSCGDEASRIILRHSEITQSLTPYPDIKACESEPATQVVGLVSRHSSTSLGFPSKIGQTDRPTASGKTRNLQDDESKDSGSRTPSLVELMKEMCIESPGINLGSSLSDNHDGTTNVKEAVLEISKCKDELASIIEKDLHEMFLLNTSAVDGNDIDEQEVVTYSLPASPVRCDEIHLRQEVEPACTKVEISSDLLTYAPNYASVNTPSIAITAKMMEQEALTYEESILDCSKLSHPPLSGNAACGIDEPVPLTNLFEENKKQFQDSGKPGAYLIGSKMETIDLDDKVELQESCASNDVRDLFAVSERVKGFRSIKRRILDAFALRPRTVKDYEQLGILHGDLNFEYDRHLMVNTVSFRDKRGLTEHPDDSDWELL